MRCTCPDRRRRQPRATVDAARQVAAGDVPDRVHDRRPPRIPADKPGLAYLTAQMLADGGTKDLTYKQVVDALFPMAAGVSAQVDKEMTTFAGATHVDNLDALLQAAARHAARSRLARGRFPPRQGRRHQRHQGRPARQQRRGTGQGSAVRDASTRARRTGTTTAGTVSALEKMTLDDVKAFYKSQYTQSQLDSRASRAGIRRRSWRRMKKDFAALPAAAGPQPRGYRRRRRSTNRAS